MNKNEFEVLYRISMSPGAWLKLPKAKMLMSGYIYIIDMQLTMLIKFLDGTKTNFIAW